MKKIFMFTVLLFLSSLWIHQSNAESYTTYQEVTFKNKGAKLLESYAESDYDKYYDKLGKKRFWGWKTYIAYENEKCSFISETLYIIVNEGDTAIEESIRFSKESSVKKHYGVSGNLETSGSGTVKGFKLGLEKTLDFDQDLTMTETSEEVYTLKIKVDPNTKLKIMIAGEGKVSNGVGKYYRFFKNVKKGGWEIFTITTEYYSIEKTRLPE